MEWNKCSTIKKYRNTMITFLASGLWHGASWNYVVWGGLHGIYQVVAQIVKPYKDKVMAVLKIKQDVWLFRVGQAGLTFLLTCFAWIFFRANGVRAALDLIRRMFGTFNLGIFFAGDSLYQMGLSHSEFNVAIAGIIVLLVVDWLRSKYGMDVFNRQGMWFRWMVYVVMMLVILVFGVYGMDYAQSQFI
ncbi:hypothetical protein LQZ18_07020 [Lachnospiraceae bacterium ZAX-1]